MFEFLFNAIPLYAIATGIFAVVALIRRPATWWFAVPTLVGSVVLVGYPRWRASNYRPSSIDPNADGLEFIGDMLMLVLGLGPLHLLVFVALVCLLLAPVAYRAAEEPPRPTDTPIE